MRFLSLFSGIEAASVAWLPMGWECVGVSEVERFCCAALEYHYPEVPNLGDIQTISRAQIEDLGHIDVVVFGFPCQDLSVAGKRKGLTHDGTPTRSGLFFDAMRIVEWSGARWALAENVPGLFSSNGGRDFATVVGEMAGAEIDVPEDGWQNTGVAAGESGLVEWCVLDAQWFGVPQRRRRVFLVRDTGDWRSRPPILFDCESLCGNPPPSREAGAGVAGAVTKRIDRGGVNSEGHDEHLVARPLAFGSTVDHYDESQQTYVTGPLQAHSKEHGHAMTTQQAAESGQIIPILEAGARQGHRDTSRDGIGVGNEGDPMFTLQSGKQHAIAFDCKQSGEGGEVSPPLRALSHDKSHVNAGGQMAVAYQCHGSNGSEMGTMRAGNQGVTGGVPFVEQQMAVRRLTPRECERLQGFPTVRERVIIELCSDHQNNAVRVGLRYRRLPSSVSPAEGDERNVPVPCVDATLWNDQEGREAIAAVHVRMSHEPRLVAIRNLGNFLWSASGVDKQNLCPLSMHKPDDFALHIAAAKRILVPTIQAGKAVSPQPTKPFTLPLNGSWPAAIFGHENKGDANGAGNSLTEDIMSTISSDGPNIPNSDSTEATWLCFVLSVIGTCIPQKTRPTSSAEIILDFESDYTLIPYRNKPADQCPDGPRYRALGNSMAVPVMRWLGTRIQQVAN